MKIALSLMNMLLYIIFLVWTSRQQKIWRGTARELARAVGDWSEALWDGDLFETTRAHVDRVDKICRAGSGATWPLTRRMRELKEIFRFPQENHLTATLLATLPRSLSGGPVLRALDHGLVVTLLFAGIIGTFFGLMEFVTGPHLADFLNATMKPSLVYSTQGGHLLEGLGVAFSANLIAYILYVAARLLLDFHEDEYENLAAQFIEGVQGSLVAKFPERFNVGSVNLTEGSSQALRKTADAMGAAANDLRPAAEAILAASGEAARTIERAAVLTKATEAAIEAFAIQVQKSISATEAATAGWLAMQCDFRETTQSAGETMAKLIGAVADAAAGIDRATGRIDEALTAATARATAIGSEIAGQVARQGQAFQVAGEVLIGQIEAVGDAMKKPMDRYEAISTDMAAAVRETAAARKTLDTVITTVVQAFERQNRATETGWIERQAQEKAIHGQLLQALTDLHSRMDLLGSGQAKIADFLYAPKNHNVLGLLHEVDSKLGKLCSSSQQ
jgi:hypothetical protein